MPASPLPDEASLHLAKPEFDLGDVIPTMAGIRGETRDPKIAPGDATVASGEPPTPVKPAAQVKHWQQSKKPR